MAFYKNSLFMLLTSVTVLVIVLMVGILYLNDGVFVYTIDDAYIHLALSDNILNGHYGLNMEEAASPSSSVAWPWLLALLVKFGFSSWSAFLLNVVSLFGFCIVIHKTVERFYSSLTEYKKFAVSFLIVLLTAIQVFYAGMEHTLQCFLAALTAYQMIRFHQTGQVSWILIIAIISGPLVRYENAAISLSAILLLFFSDRKLIAVLCSIACAVFLSSFSLFLMSKGLEWLPTSVLIKQSLVGFFLNIDSGILEKVVGLLLNIFFPMGLIFIFLLYSSFKVVYVERKRPASEKRLFLCFLLAVSLHFLASMNYVGRYVAYIAGFIFIFVSFFLREGELSSLMNRSKRSRVIFCLSAAVFLIVGVFRTVTIPLASNNIYQQQYQMAKFAQDFYKRPVAINDLGLVSYKNENFVLDLVGLASNDLYQLTKKYGRKNSALLEEILKKRKEVKLAMIYIDWFPELPDDWELIAVLELERPNVSSAYPSVHFYMIGAGAEEKEELKGLLNQFEKTLPKGVKLNEFKNR